MIHKNVLFVVSEGGSWYGSVFSAQAEKTIFRKVVAEGYMATCCWEKNGGNGKIVVEAYIARRQAFVETDQKLNRILI